MVDHDDKFGDCIVLENNPVDVLCVESDFSDFSSNIVVKISVDHLGTTISEVTLMYDSIYYVYKIMSIIYELSLAGSIHPYENSVFGSKDSAINFRRLSETSTAIEMLSLNGDSTVLNLSFADFSRFYTTFCNALGCMDPNMYCEFSERLSYEVESESIGEEYLRCVYGE